jgi:hypothetical protein
MKNITTTNAAKFLASQTVFGTCNQIDDVNKYLDDVLLSDDYAGETEKNGNEVMLFGDGSILVRIDDEAFDYPDIEKY